MGDATTFTARGVAPRSETRACEDCKLDRADWTADSGAPGNGHQPLDDCSPLIACQRSAANHEDVQIAVGTQTTRDGRSVEMRRLGVIASTSRIMPVTVTIWSRDRAGSCVRDGVMGIKVLATLLHLNSRMSGLMRRPMFNK